MAIIFQNLEATVFCPTYLSSNAPVIDVICVGFDIDGPLVWFLLNGREFPDNQRVVGDDVECVVIGTGLDLMDTKFVIGIDLYDPLGEPRLVDFGCGDDVEVVATALI